MENNRSRRGFCNFIESMSDASPRKSYIDKIASDCKVSRSTVWRWVNGTSKPLPVYHKIISDITGIPETQLFD